MAARTGFSAASMIYQRAAELSESVEAKVRRLLAAAEAAFTAGLLDKTQQLLDLLNGRRTDSPRTSAAISHLKGQFLTWAGDPPTAALQLQRGAEKIRHIDPALAIRMSVDGTIAAVLSGQMQRAANAAQFVSDVALELGSTATPIADLITGSVQGMRGAGDDARKLLDQARPAIDIPDPPTDACPR